MHRCTPCYYFLGNAADNHNLSDDSDTAKSAFQQKSCVSSVDVSPAANNPQCNYSGLQKYIPAANPCEM